MSARQVAPDISSIEHNSSQLELVFDPSINNEEKPPDVSANTRSPLSGQLLGKPTKEVSYSNLTPRQFEDQDKT